MKDLISRMSDKLARDKILKEYYTNFFSCFNSTELFEVYDINSERFIKFPGREGSAVVNRDTLVENLAEMEANYVKIDGFLVLPYNDEEIYFNNPVFIGKTDSFYAQSN